MSIPAKYTLGQTIDKYGTSILTYGRHALFPTMVIKHNGAGFYQPYTDIISCLVFLFKIFIHPSSPAYPWLGRGGSRAPNFPFPGHISRIKYS